MGKDLQERKVVHLRGRKLTPSPCEEGFVGKDSCAFKVEEF